MVVFPPTLVKTRYPGYLWCTENHELWSFKSGKLKKVKLKKAFQYHPECYRVSVNGFRRSMFPDNLKRQCKPVPVDQFEVIMPEVI